MAFHDSEITALQGWAGGAPAVERPQPAPTRSQVPHNATNALRPCLRLWSQTGASGQVAEEAWAHLRRHLCPRCTIRNQPRQSGQVQHHRRTGASTSPGTAHAIRSLPSLWSVVQSACCAHLWNCQVADGSAVRCRLLAMGAVPTLGGLLRMPASATQLNATASPAAREVLRRCVRRDLKPNELRLLLG